MCHWLGDLDDVLDDPRRGTDLLHWLARLETEPSLLGAAATFWPWHGGRVNGVRGSIDAVAADH